MVNDWVEVSVEEIKASSVNALATGPFGSSISSRFFQTLGVPVIRGSNLSEEVGTRLITENMAFLSQEKAKEFARSVVRRGDLVFTCWGTIGQVGLIDMRSPFLEYVISNKQMKLTPNPDKADSLFLYYLFSGPEMSNRIRNQAIGSSVPGFNLGQLRSLKLLLPPLEEQRRIASILGALDDKIELNRQMNETLEAMATAIFKSWFVDFDPVAAKEKGLEPYGLNSETSTLFPDLFEHSTLGRIPKGWKVGKVSDICISQYGYTASASLKAIGPHFLRITDMNKEPWIEWHSVPYCEITYDLLQRYKLQLGDVLVSRMADPGKAAIIEEDVLAVFASYLVRLKTQNIHTSYFLFYFLRSDQYLEYTQASMSGSVQAGMNAKVITSADMLIPTENVIAAFYRAILPLRQKIIHNLQENLNLATIRDALLPKLISGEIRVKDAEKYAQALL